MTPVFSPLPAWEAFSDRSSHRASIPALMRGPGIWWLGRYLISSWLILFAARFFPFPVADLRQILAVFVDILLVLNELVLKLLLQVDALGARLRQAIDHIHHQMEAIEIVQHRHVDKHGDRALFLIAADVNVMVIVPPV